MWRHIYKEKVILQSKLKVIYYMQKARNFDVVLELKLR